MNTIFADTSFYVALLNPRDHWHKLAVELAKTRNDLVITTEYVLIKVVNAVCASARQSFVRLALTLQRDSLTKVLPSSSALYEAGLRLYADRPDKAWSLTDCISFEVSRQHGIADALTSDHHFEQAGFHLLLHR